jgi:DNA repair exonuclease SbcCD ATPase subunit
MSIRGPQALASLDEAMRDIRREEDEISKRLARSAERVTKIKETEAELFRQLAQLRLEPGVQGELDGVISQAEAKARDILKLHAQQLGQSESQVAEADAALIRLTEQRADALRQYETQQGELKALAGRVGPAIARDPAFVAAREEARELADVAAQSMRKTEQAEADRDAKGKPYRDDPLFSYLWEAGYGTPSYRANNLVRYLDGLVANLVRFPKARPNFAMLNEIPLRLREHAERQIELARQAEARLDQLETDAIDAAGGKPIRDAMEKAQARIDALDGQIVEAEDERDRLAEMVSGLSQGGNPALEGALGELATALRREDIQTLLAEARRTRTGQDDTIVAQIDDARARAKAEEDEARELQERIKTLAARRRELEDIQWEFKKQRFDDPRSTFREDRLVGDMLTDFLRGGISAASYWDQWRRSQNWSAGTGDWGGGVGLPNNGRQGNPWPDNGGSTFNWPDSSFGGGGGANRPRGGGFGGGWTGGNSGGGFSRPRTGSGGTRKHSGFKTGGKF